VRLPWSRPPEELPPEEPLVRGCSLLRAHAPHRFRLSGNPFICPGIEDRGVLPRHPSDHFIGEPDDDDNPSDDESGLGGASAG
jgi:hypothetical protein